MIKLSALQKSTRRIAIFRALQLGDLLQAVPALRAIRASFPGAEITLIGLPWAESFARRFHRYVDRSVEFAGFAGIDEVEFIPERSNRFMREQRAYGYDLAIQMHGSGEVSNRFICELAARVTAGYFEGRDRGELAIGAPYPHDLPEVYRNLGLARLLGCIAGKDDEARLEFPLFMSDHAEAAQLIRAFPRASRPWIGLHVGARPPARRWPAAYFARVSDELTHRFGAQVILTGSPDEKTIVQATRELMASEPVNLVGKTSLGGLAALIAALDLFISNDTGPAHLAYALDTPSITIFGPSDEQRWGPPDQERHRVVRHPVACSPCSYWDCPIDHRCMRGIHPRSVIEGAGELLALVRGVVA